ncbi:cyclic nucleotide-binding domain-containing protein [Moorena producens JHB]|uniref:Cyclic nucleotide-binding domain-containing protein n=1 Tax=Moorena producens (strain JHB) TaxID=1454205 RepID=A0A9Q9SV39_MOOP1|nr:cyclic nucleotide-binding domain-containing protein [Moorena producens]WAN70241.1 cyclic nucleotide-binding domain-containing protein [Moorena producens JHB]
MLCQEGAPGDHLYMIVDGKAEVFRGEKLINTRTYATGTINGGSRPRRGSNN